jgi:hypothetical protein
MPRGTGFPAREIAARDQHLRCVPLAVDLRRSMRPGAAALPDMVHPNSEEAAPFDSSPVNQHFSAP